MTTIDARLETGELSPKLVLQTERSWGTVLDIEFAPHVTVNGSPEGFREFARDLLDLVDTCSPDPAQVFEDIPPHPRVDVIGHRFAPSYADDMDAAGDHQHRDVEDQR